jgi:transposase
MEQKDTIHQALKERLDELFYINNGILPYDVTFSYYEGKAAKDTQTQREYSRDGRPECKQIYIGLVVMKEGITFSYKMFEGNRMTQKLRRLY